MERPIPSAGQRPRNPATRQDSTMSGVEQTTWNGLVLAQSEHPLMRVGGLPSAGGEPSFDWRRYVALPFVYRRLILGSLTVCALLGWLAILFWPRSYESEAKLLVRVGRESVTLDPSATTSQTLMLQKTQEEEVNSALELLGSRVILEEVVEELGAANVLEGVVPSADGDAGPQPGVLSRVKSWASSSLGSVLRTAGIKDDISDHELAVMQLGDTIEIEVPRRSTVIKIHGESKSPEMAQAMVTTLINKFMHHHIQVTATKGSQDFFVQQASEMERTLADLQEQRKERLRVSGIASIDSRRTALTGQLGNIQSELISLYGMLEQAEAEVGDLREKLAETDDEVVSAKQQDVDPTWSSMRAQLYDLELEEERLSSVYTSDHPKLSRLREQIVGARKILSEYEAERVNESTTTNPVKLRLLEDLQRQQTKIVGYQTGIEEKDGWRKKLEDEIRELLEFELELQQLDRQIDIAQQSLSSLRTKQEEARVLDALRGEEISNITVAQSASLVERAIRPKKKLLAAGALFLGCSLGCALALLRDQARTEIRTPGDIENQLGVPVAAQLPLLERGGCLDALVGGKPIDPRLSEAATPLLSEILDRPTRGLRGRLVGVVGLNDNAGTSTLAMSIARVAAEHGQLQTMIVDVSGDKRSLTRYYDLANQPGVAELLRTAVEHIDCVHELPHHSVSIVPCGTGSLPSARFGNADLRSTLEEYLATYDLVLLDLPPVGSQRQWSRLAGGLDHVVVTIESEGTTFKDAAALLQRITGNGHHQVSLVLNKCRNYVPRIIQRYTGIV